MRAVSSPGPSVWEAGVSLGEEGDVTTEAELAETGRGCAAHRAEGEGGRRPREAVPPEAGPSEASWRVRPCGHPDVSPARGWWTSDLRSWEA